MASLPDESFQYEEYVINQRVWSVLKELQQRQRVLLEIKGQELKWKLAFTLACLAGVVGVIAASYAIRWQLMLHLWLVLLLVLGNLALFFKLRSVQIQLQKAQVNFGVIRHHLQGMIEVGLCRCANDCDCKEQFRRQALQNFGVNLY